MSKNKFSLTYFVTSLPPSLPSFLRYGQTNCFILPEGAYGAYEMANKDVLIISAR